ncbi:MAG: hypothetical protein R6X34_02425, partial [Chloroflexota bacterium]
MGRQPRIWKLTQRPFPNPPPKGERTGSLSQRERAGERVFLKRVLVFGLLALLFSGCERPDPQVSVIDVNGENEAIIGEAAAGEAPPASADIPPTPIMPEMRLPTRAVYTGDPTPDAPHTSVNNLERGVMPHVVSSG